MDREAFESLAVMYTDTSPIRRTLQDLVGPSYFLLFCFVSLFMFCMCCIVLICFVVLWVLCSYCCILVFLLLKLLCLLFVFVQLFSIIFFVGSRRALPSLYGALQGRIGPVDLVGHTDPQGIIGPLRGPIRPGPLQNPMGRSQHTSYHPVFGQLQIPQFTEEYCLTAAGDYDKKIYRKY